MDSHCFGAIALEQWLFIFLPVDIKFQSVYNNYRNDGVNGYRYLFILQKNQEGLTEQGGIRMPNFTKKAIKESFIKLLNERPLSQITVKDIVEDCGINRNSFYYHFQDLPSLVEEIVTEDADRIIREYPSIDSVEQAMSVAVDFALKNRKAVLHLYHSVNRDVYEHYLKQVCNYVVTTYMETVFADQPIDAYDKEIIIRFIRCECFGQILEWMEDGMKEDIRIAFARLCELHRGMTEEVVRRSLQSRK